jgi:uncharacterized protein YecT (DUF1311 family)
MPPHRHLSAAALTAALALAGLAVPSAGAAVKAHPAKAVASAPVIREKFTLLPCPKRPRTTLQIEGCAEHRVVAADGQINQLSERIFAKLHPAGRAKYISASSAWLSYRTSACQAEASIYAGGSLQPVAYANCLAALDVSHVDELKAMLLAVSPGG